MWGAGWVTHRFWIALLTTLAAGLIGLRYGSEIGLQPVVAGLLAAVAAGCVALALARIAIFFWYGFLCWYVVHFTAPQLEVPLVCILIGGLISVLFYRFCVMLLTSAAGMILLSYGGLVLLERAIRFDAVRWVSEQKPQTIHIAFVVAVALGVVVQYLVSQAKSYYQKRWKEWSDFQKKQQQAKAPPPAKPARSWLPKFLKAG
jgi:hypothetical protein